MRILQLIEYIECGQFLSVEGFNEDWVVLFRYRNGIELIWDDYGSIRVVYHIWIFHGNIVDYSNEIIDLGEFKFSIDQVEIINRCFVFRFIDLKFISVRMW